MFQNLKQYSRLELFFIFSLAGLFLFTRLYNLTLLPIFTDESIYIYWAKFIETNASHWFLSLTDGKPPLLIWAIAVLLKIFPPDAYLLTGRLVSVIAGAIALVGIYKSANLLFSSKVASYIASFLYIISPFILLYDRMALFDSLLSAMLLWTFYFAVKTSKSWSLRDAILWGLFLGLGFLSKPTAIVFLLLTPLCYLLLINKEELQKKWKTILSLPLLAIGIGEIMNNAQRISGAYQAMLLKNQQFQQPIEKLLEDPFALTFGNLGPGFFKWILAYYTIPFLVLGMIAFLYLLFRNFKKGFILLMLWFMPIFILSTVGREIFPRYILFTTPYILLAIAGAVEGLFTKQIFPKVIAVLAIAVIWFKFDVAIITDPPSAPLPPTDYHQYISEHSSGYGLQEVFEFLDKERGGKSITVVTQGTFGLYPYAFMLEYWDNRTVRIESRWPLDKIDDDILGYKKSGRVFLVFKERSGVLPTMTVKTVFKVEKPGGDYPIIVAEL